MAGDGWLTTGRKLQLKIVFYGILLAAAIYTGIGLLNGFQYANQLIAEYPIPILLYALALIAFIPFYRKNDELIRKIGYQISWSGAILLVPAFSSWLYYSYNPPTTGIGRVTLTVSKIIVWATLIMVLGAFGIIGKSASED